MVTRKAVNSFSDAECTGTVEVMEKRSLEESESCWKTEDCVARVWKGTPALRGEGGPPEEPEEVVRGKGAEVTTV